MIAWRYVPPNAVTAANIVIAMVAVQAAAEGHTTFAAWLGMLCMISDKLDGFLAAALKASSRFGVELDSLADLVAFGVAPATIYYAFFRTQPSLGWASGVGRMALAALCAFHVVAVAVRLARFNVQAAEGPRRHYLGVPSTMVAGSLLTAFLFALKYAAAGAGEFDEPRFPRLHTDGLLRSLPFLFLVGAVAMLSSLRVPKLQRTRSRLLNVLLVIGLVIGITAILFRHAPEYLVGGALVYIATCFIYHARTAT
jgi:CDP-diacylglycerol--serine O-phosphatidyltransferase